MGYSKMNSQLSNLLRGLSDLKKYIEINKSVYTSVGFLNKNPVAVSQLIDMATLHNGFHTKKVFEYNSYIVTLYGYFERFLEDILEKYITETSSIIGNYANFDDAIKKGNLNLTLELLKSLGYPKYEHLKGEDIIQTLNDGLNADIPVLNKDAYKHHLSNFRIQSINDFFARIGIHGICEKAIYRPPLYNYIYSKYGATYNTIPHTTIFQIINDLADRRNEVSHGVSPSSILNPDIIIEYINFIILFCRSLYKVLFEHYLKYRYNYHGIPLNKMGIVRNKILLASCENCVIKLNDYIIVNKIQNSVLEPSYSVRQIKEIQHNSVQTTSITASSPIQLGLLLSNRVSATCEFKLYN